MGIPSYYKRLSSTINGLVVHHRKDGTFRPGALLFDFNCMIYQVIRGSGITPYPGRGHADADKWETDVCQAVVDYTIKVWQELGKPKTVFLGLDGMVPMAKIKQQRMRRFKSIWTAAEETARGLREVGQEHWDTNAITPGTAFMEKLGARLAQLCKVQKWTLSDASQPGEGEQKCMTFWRSLGPVSGDVVIYGLDADLILLCLLTQQLTGRKNSVWCFRETAEWEGGKDKGLAEFMRLSIDRLQETIGNKQMDPLIWTVDYVAAMSFLGNDFVPPSISLKIREGGHDQLLRDLGQLHSNGKRLVNQDPTKGWVYDTEAVLQLTAAWEAQEEKKLLEFMKKKALRVNHEDWQMTPCSWKVEESVLCPSRGVLWTDWETRMMSAWMGKGVDMSSVCKAYAQGLQWILDYYTQQRPVANLWMFPWSLPPTWRAWRKFLGAVAAEEGVKSPFEPPAELWTDQPLQAQEQLAMVLPLESWYLIRNPSLLALPKKLPHFWPKQYGFFSVGKIFMWECEAEVPLLQLATLRSTL